MIDSDAATDQSKAIINPSRKRQQVGEMPMGPLGRLHRRMISYRRARVLADRLAEVYPQGCSVLDVGCGDGMLDCMVMDRRPDLTITGIDITIRPDCAIDATPYDGTHIPLADQSVDLVTFCDVLHHTEDPAALLAEAARVARRGVLIKDHLVKGLLARPTLRLMDWGGNAPHGTVLPYNYWTEAQWRDAFAALGLRPAYWSERFGIYTPPLGLLFERSLHFMALLERA